MLRRGSGSPGMVYTYKRNALKECFRRAWEMPELQRVWDELSMEYGEL